MISLKHKMGQMLVMGFSGCEINASSPVVSWMNHEGLGGVILFDEDMASGRIGKNIINPLQVSRLTRQLNEFSDRATETHPLPLFIAIDYEGGAVDRLSRLEGSMKTITAHEQALLHDEALAQYYEKMASTLEHLGFNLNFAPVVDLNLNDKQGIIGQRGRSFSRDPMEVVRASKAFIKAFDAHGIACAYKHFPGHGSAIGDTHVGFVDVTDRFDERELLPYRVLLQDRTLPRAMVMTAHVINRHLDADGVPATLSKPMLTLLRERIGFDGLIISDDLQMEAISQHYALEDAIRLTLNAGADLMIFANQLATHEAPEIIQCMEWLVQTGALDVSRIEQSYQRISTFKHRPKISLL